VKKATDHVDGRAFSYKETPRRAATRNYDG
jgi:hypothetical protein